MPNVDEIRNAIARMDEFNQASRDAERFHKDLLGRYSDTKGGRKNGIIGRMRTHHNYRAVEQEFVEFTDSECEVMMEVLTILQKQYDEKAAEWKAKAEAK